MESGKIGVVIVAGGAGTRFGGTIPKQFHMLDSLPVLGHTINAFAGALGAETPMVVVLPETQMAFWKNLAARFQIAHHTCVAGGEERFYSVKNGLEKLPPDVALVAVHDGVRPRVSRELIERCVACASAHETAIPVVPMADSLREICNDGGSKPAPRERYRAVQTPQVFAAWMLHEAYEQDFSPSFTDDASVVEAAGHPVTLCEGDPKNLKITLESDLENL